MDFIDSIRENIKHLPNGLTTRFAPSPTGYLHLGHILSGIFVWGIAEAIDGKVVVRIEDHDQGRCRQEYVDSIIEDLEWLGFFDLKATKTPLIIQSHNQDEFDLACQSLANLTYFCDCSRKDIRASMDTRLAAEELLYNNKCRTRSLSKGPKSLRCQLPHGDISWDDLCLGHQCQTPQQQCGDLLIKDRDGHWTYQFAATVDDLNQGIDLVIRGQDLTSSTGRQMMLASLLGRKKPPLFLHHPLIVDETGKKLSKRDKASGIRDLKVQGIPPEKVLGLAAYKGGIIPSERNISVSELKAIFS